MVMDGVIIRALVHTDSITGLMTQLEMLVKVT